MDVIFSPLIHSKKYASQFLFDLSREGVYNRGQRHWLPILPDHWQEPDNNKVDESTATSSGPTEAAVEGMFI